MRAIRKSAQFHLRNIRSIRPFLTRSACETVVHAYVSSRLDSGNSLLCGITDKRLKQVQRVQNMAARVITNTRKYDHITPVLRELHWLPVKARIQFKLLCLVYKCQNACAPVYLSDLLVPKDNRRVLRSSTQNLLEEPMANNITCGDRAFKIIAPSLWNRLPCDIKQATSLDSFKRKLKTYLFKSAY